MEPVCAERQKNWKLSIPCCHVLLEQSIPDIFCSKGGHLLRKELNCADSTRCIELVQKPKSGELLSHIFPSLWITPFFFILYWFPSSPRQYTGSSVVTIILHMRSAIIRPGFWVKGSVDFESKPHQVSNSFSSNDAYPYLKNALRGIVHLQEFILLKLREEEGNFAMIKDDQYFYQRQIFIKWQIISSFFWWWLSQTRPTCTSYSSWYLWLMIS